MKSASANTSAKTSEAKTAKTVLVGLDLGTNTSCVQSLDAETKKNKLSKLIPSIVGYAKDGILDGILPGDAEKLFGDEAKTHSMHLRQVAPLEFGVIADTTAARDFCLHLRDQLGITENDETRAVIGVPARADRDARENVRNAVKGVFKKVILIPEPFLAALGFRDESKLNKDSYNDPVKNSLFVDIGAGSTDLCLVQGYYPLPEDQISIPFAGDAIDGLLNKEIKQTYPDCDLSAAKIRSIKEDFSYVGKCDKPIIIERIIRGKNRKLDIGTQVGNACQVLLDKVYNAVVQLIAMADSDSVPELLNNIVVTGGGSQIKNIGSELQRLLEEDGYEQPKVRVIGEDYKEYVAAGALKAASAAKDRQWQTLI